MTALELYRKNIDPSIEEADVEEVVRDIVVSVKKWIVEVDRLLISG